MDEAAVRTASDDHERRRGQSETLGVVLLLGVTIVGSVAVVAFGATALQDVQASSGHDGTGHAMTQFDSQAAMVALGDADRQSVTLGGSAGGTFTVEPDAGWMNVTHVNGSDPNQVETFVNVSMGALVYEDDEDDVEIAYQGGGVWRTQNGGATMVSPPEFHYRDATLTLPIITVEGAASSSGSPRALVTSEESARSVFPNSSAPPYWEDDRRYLNPITDGNVTVTVGSEYYQAWERYFRLRSDGRVVVDDENETVELTLFTTGVVGDFDVPEEGNSLDVVGMTEEHGVDDFTITLQADNDGKNFNNMHWALVADEGGDEFELHLHSPDKCSNGDFDGELDLSVYYYNGSTGYYQGWQNTSIDPATDDDFDVDCDDYTLTANFTGETELAFDDIQMTGGDSKWHYGDEISDREVPGSVTFDQHDVDGPTTFNKGESNETGFLVRHYLSMLGPSYELEVTDGPGGSSRIDESGSNGSLDYDPDGSTVITFLHVTENGIRVEFR